MKKTNIDSPFYRTMGKIGDLLFANLLWLVCCLPIVTAGASTLGLFTVVGVQCAFQQAQDYNLFLLVFVGVITGVGGGVLRDVLSNQKPYIFVKHFYACPTLIGALLCALCWRHLGDIPSMLLGAAVILVLTRWVKPTKGLHPIVFILVIAVLVQFIEIFLKKYVVALYNSLGVYLPLITTNCCVLAVTILVVDDYGADVAALGFGAAYIEALVCSIGAGVGFMLAMVMFSGVRKRVEACDPPAPFKGLPITLIAAAITSLSFMGFGGIVENLFNVTL